MNYYLYWFTGFATIGTGLIAIGIVASLIGSNNAAGVICMGVTFLLLSLPMGLAHRAWMKEMERNDQRHEAAVKEWKRRRYQARFEEYERQEADRGDPES